MNARLRFGTNPIAWSNDDKRSLGADTPLEQCLREAREAGYQGIELGHKFPRDPDALKKALVDHDLALVSGWYSSNLLVRSVAQEKQALGEHLGLLGALGCDVVIWAETTGAIHGDETMPLSRRPKMTPAEWDGFCRAITEMGQHVRAAGMQLVYHHHMGTVVETAEEIDRLMAATGDEVGLLLDSGHLSYAGASPAAVCARHRARIHHVHCKDVRGGVLAQALAADWSFLDAVVAGVFTVPGDGDVDFAAVLTALAANAYRGWLVVEAEQDPAKANPLHYATMGYRHLAALARDVKLLT